MGEPISGRFACFKTYYPKANLLSHIGALPPAGFHGMNIQ
jgi:hypothetical protein